MDKQTNGQKDKHLCLDIQPDRQLMFRHKNKQTNGHKAGGQIDNGYRNKVTNRLKDKCRLDIKEKNQTFWQNDNKTGHIDT